MRQYFNNFLISISKTSSLEWVDWFQRKIRYRKLKNLPLHRKLRRMACLQIPPVKVLYRDDKFIVLNKDFDVKMNSSDPADLITVDKQLAQSFPETVDTKLCYGFRFQQRLDYATSGVLCVGLNKSSAAEQAHALKRRSVIKHYIALVHGHVKPQFSHIDIPLCRRDKTNESDPFKMHVATEENLNSKKSKDCQTFAVKLETGCYDGSPATKLLLIAFTGRTHQLRVHCKHIGHLIIGDYTYSNRQDTVPFRMMLHAYRLRVEMKTQKLDIKTEDIFTNDNDSKWKPEEIHMSYNQSVDTLYDSLNFEFRLPSDDKVTNYRLESA